MTFFELFEIPVSFFPDKNVVKKKYFELSRKFHPDFFSRADDDEKSNALEKSSLLNKAYKTFQNENEVIKYILTEKGLLREEEKYQLPQDFLMDMLDLNEKFDESKEENDECKLSALKKTIAEKQNEIYEPVKKILENYKEGVSAEEELLQIKEYYFRKKYLHRMLKGMR